MVDSEGRDAISSSDSYEWLLEGTMYADMEKEGFDGGGEAEDMVAGILSV